MEDLDEGGSMKILGSNKRGKEKERRQQVSEMTSLLASYGEDTSPAAITSLENPAAAVLKTTCAMLHPVNCAPCKLQRAAPAPPTERAAIVKWWGRPIKHIHSPVWPEQVSSASGAHITAHVSISRPALIRTEPRMTRLYMWRFVL